MTWLRAALPLLLLHACGGHVESPERPASFGAAGERSGAAPDVADAGAGGDGTLALAGASGDGTADAGTGSAGAPSAPLIGSATRYCDNDLYCFGLSCYAPLDLAQHVCIGPCRTSQDCAPDEQCLSADKLAPGCYPSCQTPFDCEYGFDCFDFANQQQSLVCFPTPWAAAWRGKGG
jgi:hypothetical protein